MRKVYTVETIGKVIATVTDKALATILFNQRKSFFNYLTLNEVTEISGNTFKESLEIYTK